MFNHEIGVPAVHTCEQPSFFLNADVVWVDADTPETSPARAIDFSISELAAEFGITPRALRFYESKGLLAPQRHEGMRLYNKGDRDRLALVLKAKKFGFTLLEIREMIKAQNGGAEANALKLSRRKCAEQIGLLEQQLEDIQDALAELRRIHTVLSGNAA